MDRYNLTITNLTEDGKVNAQFYLTICMPSDTEGIVNTSIQCPETLGGKLPTKRLAAVEAVDNKKEYTKNGSENKLIIGNFFNQSFSVTTARGDALMTDTNSEIPIVLTTTISFKDNNAERLYGDYADGQRLYQRFDLGLVEYAGTNGTKKNMVQGTQIWAQRYLGENPIGDAIDETLISPESSYPIEYYWTDGEAGIPATEVTNGMQLKAEIILTYLSQARTEQFPVRKNAEIEDGIAVKAESRLAYSAASLNNSSGQVSGEAKFNETTPHFYREDTGSATINYVAYEQVNGAPAEGVSELGVNGREDSRFIIHSAALYNVSQVQEVATADGLTVTVTLLEKKEGCTYNQLNYQQVKKSLTNYMTSLQVNAHYKQGDSMKAAGEPLDALNAVDNTVHFELGSFDPDVQIQIPITMTVLTGDEFAGTYANYRVRVTAQLTDNGEPIASSVATDYIVYTNAKVCLSFIDLVRE